MKIVTIFADHLYAFSFKNKTDELSRLYDFWTNQKLLRDYFEKNNSVLEFENIDIEEAISETIENAELLFELLSEHKNDLDGLFEALSTKENVSKFLHKQKSRRKWLRLYAIKIESNYYVITGGAIKQSQTMQQHPDTNEESKKLESCRNYLIDNHVFDADSFNDFLYELEF
jgi:hypothetical protein